VVSLAARGIVAPVVQIVKRHGARYAVNNLVIGPISAANQGQRGRNMHALVTCASALYTSYWSAGLLGHSFRASRPGGQLALPVSSPWLLSSSPVAATFARPSGVIPRAIAESELS
jgi:hypothetical protein